MRAASARQAATDAASLTPLQLVRRRHPVEERPHPGLVDREDDAERVLLRARLVEPADVDRVEARVAIQLLNHLARLVVAGPEIAGPRASLPDAAVAVGEVDVERLR